MFIPRPLVPTVISHVFTPVRVHLEMLDLLDLQDPAVLR